MPQLLAVHVIVKVSRKGTERSSIVSRIVLQQIKGIWGSNKLFFTPILLQQIEGILSEIE